MPDAVTRMRFTVSASCSAYSLVLSSRSSSESSFTRNSRSRVHVITSEWSSMYFVSCSRFHSVSASGWFSIFSQNSGSFSSICEAFASGLNCRFV